MDFNETSEHLMLREAVRKIASDFGHDYFVEKARADERAHELWEAVARGGFMGVNIPEEYGGGGMGLLELSMVGEELAAGGCPLLLMVVSPAICGSIIARHGTEEQKRHWLPKIAGSEDPGWKMAFAITEPNAGSNSHNISTVATRDGGEYRLRGTKYYISGVDEADTMLVVARTGVDEGSGRAKLSLFIVDCDAPGLERTVIPVEIVAPEKQYTLFFDDVRVPADRLVGAEHEGLRQVFAGLNPERIMGAAQGNGIGRYALEKAAAYAVEREVWGVPIGMHQGVSHPLATAKIELDLARLMTTKAAWLYDTGGDAGEAANMAKYASAEASLKALDQAIQTHGGNGMATEYGLATLWGTARLFRTAPVSREMVLNFVAQHSLGLPKSY
ncbi:MAG: acyl-CoA dehydrogenase family protein [Acidimicrobiia bacterium]